MTSRALVCVRFASRLSHLSHHVVGGSDTLDLLLLGGLLVLLHLVLVLLLEEVTLCSFLQVGNLFEFNPVLRETDTERLNIRLTLIRALQHQILSHLHVLTLSV